MVRIMIGSSCDSNLRSTRESLISTKHEREFDTSYFHDPHSPGVNDSLFIMLLKEMVSMELKGQPGAAPAVSPLLSLESADQFHVIFHSPPPPREIA
jgi:hypothetical protein